MALNDEQKKHFWYFLKFKRCIRLHKLAKPTYYSNSNSTCMAILCASYVKSEDALRIMSFLNATNRQLQINEFYEVV